MANYTLKQFKSALNIRKSPDNWFWEKYGLNVYNGCEHGCIYCDSRSAKYHLPFNFEEEIIVKENISQLLEDKIKNARKLLPDVIGISGSSDAYHPAETQYFNTQKCLDVIKKWQFPVHILTKSELVLRDLDVLEEIGKQNWSCISVTITSSNEQLSKFLEPHAPSPDQRFKIFEAIKSKTGHIQCGVLLMPVIPFLTDSKNGLEDLIVKAKAHGADYVLFGSGLTLRNVQALYFLNRLKSKIPNLISNYEQIYQFQYNKDSYSGAYAPMNEYIKSINKTIISLCHKHSMPIRIKRYIPNDFRILNYKLSEQLFSEAYNLELSGGSAEAYYKTAVAIQNLNKPLLEIYQNNLWQELTGLTDDIKKRITNEVIQKYGKVDTHRQLGLF